jgi:hypothetical protein
VHDAALGNQAVRIFATANVFGFVVGALEVGLVGFEVFEDGFGVSARRVSRW